MDHGLDVRFAGGITAFHRASDEVVDPVPALEVLIEAGVAGVVSALSRETSR